MKYIDALNEWSGRIFSTLSLAIIGIIIYDVIARAIFRSPLAWSFEISTQLYAVLFMMLGGYALLHNAHVNVEILCERFSQRVRKVVDILCYFVFFFPFVGVMVFYGFRFARRSWAISETTWGAAALPVYPVKTVIFISGCLLFLQGMAQVARLFLSLTAKRETSDVA